MKYQMRWWSSWRLAIRTIDSYGLDPIRMWAIYVWAIETRPIEQSRHIWCWSFQNSLENSRLWHRSFCFFFFFFFFCFTSYIEIFYLLSNLACPSILWITSFLFAVAKYVLLLISMFKCHMVFVFRWCRLDGRWGFGLILSRSPFFPVVDDR